MDKEELRDTNGKLKWSLDAFQSDEEPEHEDQGEDMKEYQEKLNSKISVLVQALEKVKEAITKDDTKIGISEYFDECIKENSLYDENEEVDVQMENS